MVHPPLVSPTRTKLEEHRVLMREMHRRRGERASVIPPSDHPLPDLPSSPSPPINEDDTHQRPAVDISDIPEAKRRKYEAYYPTYCWDEETIRNDLPERYSVSGDWGGNAIHGADEGSRCEEYPRQRRLLNLKSDLLQSFAHPPLFLPLPERVPIPSTAHHDTEPSIPRAVPLTLAHPLPTAPTSLIAPPPPPSQLAKHLLQTLGPAIRFDSIHIAPPPDMPWSEVLALPIRQIAAEVGFIFLWVGTGSKEGGLEQGREALTRWGFRKCEEIVWVKTNRTRHGGPGIDPPTDSIFQNTKEHCLMGIRGTVRRATDGHFVHTNIDTDVIVWEGDPTDPHRKPPELYSLVENFCLGLRRLDLFGSESRARPGWVTAGYPSSPSASSSPSNGVTDAPVVVQLEAMVEHPDGDAEWDGQDDAEFPVEPFDRESYLPLVTYEGKHFLPTTNDIESLRPKSPNKGRPHSSQSSASTHLNNGTSRPASVTPSSSNLPSRPQSSQPMMAGGFSPGPSQHPGAMGGMGGMMMSTGGGFMGMAGPGMPGMMMGGMGIGPGGMGMGFGGAGGGMMGGAGMGFAQQPFGGQFNQQQQQQQQFAGGFGHYQQPGGPQPPQQMRQQFFPSGGQAGGQNLAPQYQSNMGFQQAGYGQQQFPQQGLSPPSQPNPTDFYQQQLLMQQMMMGQFPAGGGGGGAFGGGFMGGQSGQGGYGG